MINVTAYTFNQDYTISRGSKYYLMVLEYLGYSRSDNKLEMEKQLANGLLQCDFYLKDLDMVIDVHGPVHYRN